MATSGKELDAIELADSAPSIHNKKDTVRKPLSKPPKRHSTSSFMRQKSSIEEEVDALEKPKNINISRGRQKMKESSFSSSLSSSSSESLNSEVKDTYPEELTNIS